MSDLFEENENELIETLVDFEEVEHEMSECPGTDLDARRRLEQLLEERRLRNELDDFVDY